MKRCFSFILSFFIVGFLFSSCDFDFFNASPINANNLTSLSLNIEDETATEVSLEARQAAIDKLARSIKFKGRAKTVWENGHMTNAGTGEMMTEEEKSNPVSLKASTWMKTGGLWTIEEYYTTDNKLAISALEKKVQADIAAQAGDYLFMTDGLSRFYDYYAGDQFKGYHKTWTKFDNTHPGYYIITSSYCVQSMDNTYRGGETEDAFWCTFTGDDWVNGAIFADISVQDQWDGAYSTIEKALDIIKDSNDDGKLVKKGKIPYYEYESGEYEVYLSFVGGFVKEVRIYRDWGDGEQCSVEVVQVDKYGLSNGEFPKCSQWTAEQNS